MAHELKVETLAQLLNSVVRMRSNRRCNQHEACENERCKYLPSEIFIENEMPAFRRTFERLLNYNQQEELTLLFCPPYRTCINAYLAQEMNLTSEQDRYVLCERYGDYLSIKIRDGDILISLDPQGGEVKIFNRDYPVAYRNHEITENDNGAIVDYFENIVITYRETGHALYMQYIEAHLPDRLYTACQLLQYRPIRRNFRPFQNRFFDINRNGRQGLIQYIYNRAEDNLEPVIQEINNEENEEEVEVVEDEEEVNVEDHDEANLHENLNEDENAIYMSDSDDSSIQYANSDDEVDDENDSGVHDIEELIGDTDDDEPQLLMEEEHEDLPDRGQNNEVPDEEDTGNDSDDQVIDEIIEELQIAARNIRRNRRTERGNSPRPGSSDEEPTEEANQAEADQAEAEQAEAEQAEDEQSDVEQQEEHNHHADGPINKRTRYNSDLE